MELMLSREPPTPDSILGSLFLNDSFFCYTLENLEDAIPLGRYKVEINKSRRSAQGFLWSPKDNLLPEVMDVPGRSGIRIHSGNTYNDLEGCIAVGLVKDDDAIDNSRTALSLLMVKLLAIEDEENWITVA